MEGQSGTEDRCHHHIVHRHVDLCVGKRRMHGLLLIVKRFAYLVCHHLAHSLYVVAEEQSVLLIVLVAHLCQILVDDRILITEIYYFHREYIVLSLLLSMRGCL